MPTKVILLSWTSPRVNKSISREKNAAVAIQEDKCSGNSLVGKEAIVSLLKNILLAKCLTLSPMTSLREQRESKIKIQSMTNCQDVYR